MKTITRRAPLPEAILAVLSALRAGLSLDRKRKPKPEPKPKLKGEQSSIYPRFLQSFRMVWS